MSPHTRSGASTPHLDPPKTNGTKKSSPIPSQLELDMPNTGWQEPPLKTPQPTYQEQGVEKNLLLKNMMPLGTRPTARQLAKATPTEQPRRWTAMSRSASGLAVPEIRTTSESLATGATSPAEDDSRPQSSSTEQPSGMVSETMNGQSRDTALLQSSAEPVSAVSSAPPEVNTPAEYSGNLGRRRDVTHTPTVPYLDTIANATGDFKLPYDQALHAGDEETAMAVKYLQHKATTKPAVDRILTAMANTEGNPQDRPQSLLVDHDNLLRKLKKRFKGHLHEQKSAIGETSTDGLKPLDSVEAQSTLEVATPMTEQTEGVSTRRRTRALAIANATPASAHMTSSLQGTGGKTDQFDAPKTLKLLMTHKSTPTPSGPNIKPDPAYDPMTLDLSKRKRDVTDQGTGNSAPKKLRLITKKPSAQVSSAEETPQASSQVPITGSSADQSPADSTLLAAENNIDGVEKRPSSSLSSAIEPGLPPAPAKKRVSPRENKGKKRARKDSAVAASAKLPELNLEDPAAEDRRRQLEAQRVKESAVPVVESNSRAPRDGELRFLPPQTPDVTAPPAPTSGLRLNLTNTGRRAAEVEGSTSLAENTADHGSRRSARVRAAAKTKSTPTKHDTGKAALGSEDEQRRLSGATDESADHCHVCNEGGDLVCCDLCPRSFHYGCVRPQLNKRQVARMPVWVCPICTGEGKTIKQAQELRAAADEAETEGKKASEYALEAPVKDHFEEGGPGDDWKDYCATPKEVPNVNGKAPDGYRVHDKDGKPIFCFSCKKGSDEYRYIMQCDYCNEKWHLDCLNPPLLNPPARCVQNGKTRHAWMCPLHAEHTQRLVNQIDHDARPKDRRYRKVRARIARQVPENRGNIQVVDDEPEEDDRFETVNGEVLQVSAHGIKLDFIARIRENNRIRLENRAKHTINAQLMKAEQEEKEAIALAKKAEAEAHAARLFAQSLHKHSIVDHQAALSLVQFKNQDTDIEMADGDINSLVHTLVEEAPLGVLDDKNTAPAFLQDDSPPGVAVKTRKRMASKTSPASGKHHFTSVVPDDEREKLLKLQELIARRLAS